MPCDFDSHGWPAVDVDPADPGQRLMRKIWMGLYHTNVPRRDRKVLDLLRDILLLGYRRFKLRPCIVNTHGHTVSCTQDAHVLASLQP